MKNSEILKENIFLKVLRILLGLVFIFSSVVKGIDPLGTAYRVEDYLLVYNLEWFTSLKFYLAILLITVEFILGFALVFKIRYKAISWAALGIMIFFTIVTWFDAKENLVPDCGCFGDAIKLTNWETFYKNIVLLLIAIILLFQKKPVKQKVPVLVQNMILLVVSILFISFQMYNYNHLPVIDFRDWKVGKDMRFKNLDKEKIYLTYKNKKTGEIKEYISPDYPWQDSVWRAEWEFVGKRIDDSKVIKPHNLVIEDESGNEITKDVINHQGYVLLIISNNLTKANGDGMIKASMLADAVKPQGINSILITGTFGKEVQALKTLYTINYPVGYADETELKAMIRSNPGVILLHNGVILAKWHYNDIPSKNEFLKFIKTHNLN